ncbi:MAG: ABC transporter ATP-binding protein [Coriobacteriia bacterium]
MTAPSLEFRGVTVGYGARTVVRDAALEVRPGEFVGLVGPNGAGKSTLLRAVTGGADVLSGDIVCGSSVLRLPERERAQLIGVVPQSQPSAFAFTARAFVEMGRHPHLGRLASLGPDDHAVVDEVMERTDTARLAAERIDELSGGDLQRLTLAQALAQQPRVLLLDEPTSHLDLNHALQVLDLVRSLADGGIAVLGVFHDLGIAARYADRMSIVADGRLTPSAPPAEALSSRVISDVFGVRAVVRTDPVTGSVAVTPVLRGEDLTSDGSRGTVGLVCGSGTGIALMRDLMRTGYDVAAGALNRGDVDQAVAEALGVRHAALPPFGEIDADAQEAVRRAYAEARCVVVCPTPFGRSNLPNLRAAFESGRPLVLVGDMTPDRDFSGGEATDLWLRAVDGGATIVASESDVLAIVESTDDEEEA